MLINFFEDTVPVSIDVIRDRIIHNTKLVKFGPFGLYPTDYENFREDWLGQYHKDLDRFKLFKTQKNSEYTSEFYIKGTLLEKFESTTIRYSIGVHYMLVVALLGLIVFSYAIFYLIDSKLSYDILWLWIPACLILTTAYLIIKRKDYLDTLKSFRRLVQL